MSGENGRNVMTAGQVLRRLATRAMGLTGADVERVIREARLKARREKRPMTYADVEAGIRGRRPPLSYDVRWRLAIHESGHAVVHHALRLGAVLGLSIDARDGGQNTITFGNGGPDTVEWYERLLALLMAGRAAELIVLKTASAGSGGAEHSDLARATRIAIDMEQALGFGARYPLLYLDHRDPTAILSRDDDLAKRVHRHLEFAQARATEVILENRTAFDRLVRALFDAQALDGDAVMDILTSSP
ncbi:ATP-dependent metallopeptidase FtsH/Yme1/Tma family protein [Sinorhizobium meliloti]|uniref:ATP-dependent Zn protease n=1 Tax=Rhizobium meliloti TaxID=382 RepID=UPI000FD508CE|nr:ATP-dependent Zn protease [Sinorhizobium meliloti]RVM09376.1 ATP-dependent Zn protease [Sinorhizobium meliloti]RVM50014.1 ATP-dependent Zn protease [Sinorhizobium meliloti]RVM66797.1 ATP-dependent Zn protease [Sinorhizobium meliloti]RVM72972.1 ATP-dependent Zn protease [Sinorhizobium meliloti]RVM87634.1 ATP-dependent Zn protease [Sinorhizobium meliloti]